MQRAVDQVIHDVALQELPVVFAMDRSGAVPDDGETHQGLYDIALFRPVPGLVITSYSIHYTKLYEGRSGRPPPRAGPPFLPFRLGRRERSVPCEGRPMPLPGELPG